MEKELRQLINELSDSLEEQKKNNKSLMNQLLDTRHELMQKDYRVENQQKALENSRKTLERYEKENRALRELVSLWV